MVSDGLLLRTRPLSETNGTALDFDGWYCPLPLRDSPNVVMGHGGGDQLSAELVDHLFVPAFGSPPGGGQAHPLGAGAAVIGECVSDHPGMVVARTSLGGTRVVDMPLGEQLPRIC